MDIGLKNHVSDRKTFTIKQKTVGKLLIRNCTPKLLPSGREMNGLAMLLFYNLYQWDSFGMVFIGLIITTFLTVWRNLGVFSSSLPLFSNSHRTLLLEHHILLECLMKNKWQYQALPSVACGFNCLCYLQMVRGEPPWAGAEPCVSRIPVPGRHVPGVDKRLCQQMYTKILKNSTDISPSILPDFPFCSSLGKFLDCTCHLERDSPLCWQLTLEIKNQGL